MASPSLRSPATNPFLLVLLALSFGCGGGDGQTPTAPPPPAATPAPSPPPEPVLPDTPQNVRVLSTTQTSIVWTWDPVPEADGYEVEVLNQLSAVVGESEVTEPEATASDLSPETSLFLRARAFVGEGNARLRSEWTLPVQGMTDPPPEFQADYRITNVERYSWSRSINNADWLYFTVQSRVSAERLEVSVIFEQGDFDSHCSERFHDVTAGSQEQTVVPPASCGADVQWPFVTISPGDSYTCEGCGTFNRESLPRRSRPMTVEQEMNLIEAEERPYR